MSKDKKKPVVVHKKKETVTNDSIDFVALAEELKRKMKGETEQTEEANNELLRWVKSVIGLDLIKIIK